MIPTLSSRVALEDAFTKTYAAASDKKLTSLQLPCFSVSVQNVAIENTLQKLTAIM